MRSSSFVTFVTFVVLGTTLVSQTSSASLKVQVHHHPVSASRTTTTTSRTIHDETTTTAGANTCLILPSSVEALLLRASSWNNNGTGVLADDDDDQDEEAFPICSPPGYDEGEPADDDDAVVSDEEHQEDDVRVQRPRVTLDDVRVSLLPLKGKNHQGEVNGPLQGYPLVITPLLSDNHGEQRQATTSSSTDSSSSSVEFLSAFMKDNQEWIDEMMIQYGAVLFRGFNIKTALDIQDALIAYTTTTTTTTPGKGEGGVGTSRSALSDVYRGTSPRHSQGGSRYIFSAAEVPSHYPIAQHCEMSFLKEVPPKLFFSALSAPRTIGGETALTDVRKVYRDLPNNLRHKLQTKKLRYTRTHTYQGERFTHDVAAMLSWPEMFRTTNKTQVEELSAKEGMPVRWESHKSHCWWWPSSWWAWVSGQKEKEEEDIFVSEFETEAFQLHPETGEPVWYNHIQVFHWTSFPAELYSAFQRTGDIRYLIRSVVIGFWSWIKYGLLQYNMALHVTYGDGEPISIWEAHQIRTVIHQNTYYNPWEQGDIVAIDNWSVAHGRSPTYDSGRNIVVAWTQPVPKQDALRT